MRSSETISDNELRQIFTAQLALMTAGDTRRVPSDAGLDDRTIDALEAVGAAAPNPPATLIEAARIEFGKQLDGTHFDELYAEQSAP